MNRGPANFAQPEFGDAPFLNGRRFSGAFRWNFTPSAGANVLQMGKGVVIQAPLLEDDDPVNAQAYQISWAMRIANEDDWRYLRMAHSLGRPVWLIPFCVEMDHFRCAPGDNAYTLSRPLASAKESTFDSVAYPTSAWLDTGTGPTELTIVSTAPSAGELQVTGDDQVQPENLSAAADLWVAYYPAYPVVIPTLPKSLLNFNDLTVSVVALEATKQEPT